MQLYNVDSSMGYEIGEDAAGEQWVRFCNVQQWEALQAQCGANELACLAAAGGYKALRCKWFATWDSGAHLTVEGGETYYAQA